MAIVCPYCGSAFQLKDIKPGRYRPKCPKCGERFGLTVPSTANSEPLVEKLEETPPAAPPIKPSATVTQPGNAEVTLPPSAPATALPPTTVPSPNEDLKATVSASLSPPSDIHATLPATAGEITTAGSAQRTLPQQVSAKNELADSLDQEIGGYRLIKELGRGAMGTVYLAKQISLDRDVALKVIQAQWAQDATFIARFTREAYAAAQLNHHNMVQIYDLGAVGPVNYFSMEFVRGQTLSELVDQQGKIDPDVAIGYILQAARGLEHAHSHGMVHRDVKPANLMVNADGVVKVADLGLVKTPQMEAEPELPTKAKPLDSSASAKKTLSAATASVTLANIAMGTPAYMAPEQAENAAGVDHRADIYSLGCTLYVLLTGRPPFEGASALEVITKHRSEPVVRPDVLVKRIPKELADITLKMVAKRPEDRYTNLREVIRDLERYLGLPAEGAFSPREEQVQVLEQSAAAFHESPLANLRLPGVLAFFAGCGVLFLVSLALGWFTTALAFVGFAAAASIVYFIYSGWLERTYLFDKLRELVALARWTDLASWLIGGLLISAILLLLGLFWTLLQVTILGGVVGLTYYYLVDRRLTSAREKPLAEMHDLLKSLRLKGISEESLRQFVARYSGDHWEEFFEALFGYEAKVEARERFGRGEQGRRRSRFRAWREPVVKWINQRIQAAKEERDRKHLQLVEEKNLTAQGLQPMQARRQAQRMAQALVEAAAAEKAAQPASDPALEAQKKRERIKSMLVEARGGEYGGRKAQGSLLLAPIRLLLGPRMRFFLGGALLLGFAVWAKQTDAIHFRWNQVADLSKVTSLEEVASGVQINSERTGTSALRLPLFGQWFDSFNPGIAGALLLFLGLFRGWKMSLFALPAAAVILFGPHLGMPGIAFLGGGYATSATIGLAIGALGILYGQTFDD